MDKKFNHFNLTPGTPINVAVIGATGVVGQSFLRELETSSVAIQEIRLFASEKGLTRELKFKNKKIAVTEISKEMGDETLKDLFFSTHLIFSSVAESESLELLNRLNFVPVIIDNSSAFRMDKNISLVVPEINFQAIQHKTPLLIANPNCSTIQLVHAIDPMLKIFKIKRVFVSTYQSISGAGGNALLDFQRKINETQNDFRNFPEFLKLNHEDFKEDLRIQKNGGALNCIPKIGEESEKFPGQFKEEIKIISETKKILNLPNLVVNATAVRVPVPYCHSEAVTIETEEKIEGIHFEELQRVYDSLLHIRFNPNPHEFYSVQESVNSNYTHISRLRRDPYDPYLINLWVVADNLTIGASLNAIRIAEKLCLAIS